jgi:hypothetical protein
MVRVSKKLITALMRGDFARRHPHQGHGKGQHAGYAERSPP